MKILTMIFSILLFVAFISMAWPFLLGLLVILAVMGIVGTLKIRKMRRQMDEAWSQEDQIFTSYETTQDDSAFEQRADNPEVIEAEYTERRADDDGRQSDSAGL